MPNVVRFTLSTARDLYVSGAGQFIDGVLDVDVNDLTLLSRTRYLVVPYGATEIGIVDSATPYPSLPAVPVPPPADPYPQYLDPSEVLDSGTGKLREDKVPERLTEVAQRAASVSAVQDAEVASRLLVDGVYVPEFDLDTTPVTAEDIGLGNVDNTADIDKPLSAAALEALERGDRIANTVETIPRRFVAPGAGVAGSVGQVRLTYLTPETGFLASKVRMATGGTAAGATPTLVKMGLYRVEANRDLTLVASTASDTALFSASYSVYERALTVPYQVVAGQRYAAGFLIASAAAAPTLAGSSSSFPAAELAREPRVTATIPAVTDLPATATSASLQFSGGTFYVALSA